MNQGDKAYSRDYTMRGRAKVMLKDGNKKPINPEYPNSKFYFDFHPTTFNALNSGRSFLLPIVMIMPTMMNEYELIPCSTGYIYTYIYTYFDDWFVLV